MNRKKIFFWSVFYILLFIWGYFSDKIITRIFPSNVNSSEVIVYSPPPANSKLDAANELRAKYIDGLGFHVDTAQGTKSTYLKTKKDILDAYQSGNRSPNLMRAYIYLVAQEGDFAEKERLVKEFCKSTEMCKEFIAQISITWIVRNPQWKPIASASVEVLGTPHKTTTNAKGEYGFTLSHISPAVLRLQASSPNTMLSVQRAGIVDATTALDNIQSFHLDFTLNKAFTEISIDTKKKTITGEGASKDEKWYFIQTPYTKYLIPFDAIVKEKTPYTGKLKAMVFEFDRQSSSYLLNSDVFDQVGNLISQTLITFGMPFIIFTAENGERLDVLSTNPMTIWTTIREKKEIDNFLEYLPEYREMFGNAYKDSQQSPPGTYPINSLWEYEHGNKKMIPQFWVFDRATGFWSNEWFRFVTDKFTSPYNMESHFYTVRVQK